MWINLSKRYVSNKYIQLSSITFFIFEVNNLQFSWMYFYRNFYGNQIQDACLLPNNLQSQETLAIFHIASINQTFSTLYVIPPCTVSLSFIQINTNISKTHLFTLQSHINRDFTQKKNISVWPIYYTPGLNDNMSACDREFVTHVIHYETDQLLDCFIGIYIWKSIVGQNFQLNSDFINGSSYTQIKFITGAVYDSIYFFIEYPSEQVRFISCGDTYTGKKPLHSTLLESFDFYCWAAILVVFNILMPFVWSTLAISQTNLLSINMRIYSDIIGFVFKNLVEQSTPYPTKILAGLRLKVLAACTLFCALVLSNAYKNDNMYELIAPKKFEALQHFEQLLTFNYSIYAEPYQMYITRDCTVNYSAFQQCLDSGLTSDQHTIVHKNVLTRSRLEVYSYLDAYVANFGNGFLKLPQKIANVYTNSALLIDAVFPTARSYFIKNVETSMLRLVFNKENSLSAKLLSKCNRSAIVASNTRILEIEKALKNYGSSRISVGTDVLFERRVGFFLGGWIPDFIQLRI